VRSAKLGNIRRPPTLRGSNIRLGGSDLVQCPSVHLQETCQGAKVVNKDYTSVKVLFLPYVLFLGICAESLAFGLTRPESIRVTGSGMYCNSGLAVPGRISAGIVTVVLAPAIIIEIFMVISLRKYWAVFQGLAGSSRVNLLSMMFRVFLFSVFGIFALGLSIFFFFTVHHGAALNIVVAFIPVMAVCVFGSQKDLLRVWMFWKWKSKKEEEDLYTLHLSSTKDSSIKSPSYEKDLPPLPA